MPIVGRQAMGWDAGTTYLSGASAVALLASPLAYLHPRRRLRRGREAARQVRCLDNLKQIDLALRNFSVHRGDVPRAISDERGRPLLSWRVAILPFLGHDLLYRRFRVGEPWDSPHNLALLPLMPAVYACPSIAGRDPTHTPYKMLNYYTDDLYFHSCSGPPERWPGAAIRVAEAAVPAPWTKPEELALTGVASCPSVGRWHLGGAHVLLGDGSVHRATLRTG